MSKMLEIRIEGETGAGKSTLLRLIADCLAAHGIVATIDRSYEDEDSVPFDRWDPAVLRYHIAAIAAASEWQPIGIRTLPVRAAIVSSAVLP